MMYFIIHLYVVKDSWFFEILKHCFKFQNFRIPHFLNYHCFFNVGNICLSSIFFSMKIILFYESFWESFAKLTICNAVGIHFQMS